jgi:hypothetical protein
MLLYILTVLVKLVLLMWMSRTLPLIKFGVHEEH